MLANYLNKSEATTCHMRNPTQMSNVTTMMQPHGCCHDDFAALFPASSDVFDRCSAAGLKWPNCLIYPGSEWPICLIYPSLPQPHQLNILYFVQWPEVNRALPVQSASQHCGVSSNGLGSVNRSAPCLSDRRGQSPSHSGDRGGSVQDALGTGAGRVQDALGTGAARYPGPGR